MQFGLADWVDYFQRVAALPIAPDTSTADEMADAINQSGFAVIGTPDDAIAQIQRLWDQSDGGFGTFLVMAPRVGRHRADAQELRAARALRVPRLPGIGRVDRRAHATGRPRTARRSSARSAPPS